MAKPSSYQAPPLPAPSGPPITTRDTPLFRRLCALEDEAQRMIFAGLKTAAQIGTYDTLRRQIADLWERRREELARLRSPKALEAATSLRRRPAADPADRLAS